METNFGTSTPYSLGIEEEFQILDGETLGLVSGIEGILAVFEGDAQASRITPELLQSVVEVSTRIASTVPEAIEDLGDLRSRLRQAAEERDASIASAGTHPFSRYRRQEITERPRYVRIARRLRWLAERQTVFGLHVHVGMGSADKAIACANGMRRLLPALLALSANSPFWQGRATGLASNRIKVNEGLPRAGLPPAFGSFAEFEAYVDTGVRTGCFPDYTHIWWDMRPHPRLGTLEIRICDAQTRLESVKAIAALVQSLVATIGSDFDCGAVPAPGPDVVIEENRWRATRDGLDAMLIDLDGRGERSAGDTILELVDRCLPAAEVLGCAAELEGVEQIVDRGSGADEQRRVFEETGSLVDVTRWLVDQTAVHDAAGRR